MKRLTSWASQHRSGLLLLLFLAVAAPFSPTITQIIAGNGLTGGGNGGSVTVSLSAPVSIANGGTGSTTGSAAGLNNIPVSYVVQRYATPGTFAITPLPAGAVWVDFSGFGAGSGGGSGRRGTNPSSEAAAAPVVHMRHTDCRHLYLPLETLSQSVMAALAEQLSQQITPTETMGRRATIRL